MGKPTNEESKSRRWFLSLFTNAEKNEAAPGMVKMLTADGKLVEIDKSVLEAATKNKNLPTKKYMNGCKIHPKKITVDHSNLSNETRRRS
ncbi:MAG: hypothetical protein IPP72_21035 [Chitinophagaceae bacterium]|nr:hypothetical protein [Chitinophagaceae bacterium]